MENLLNLIFPSKCLFCNKIESVFCNECLSKCKVLNSKINLTYKYNLTAYFWFEYTGLVKKCIGHSKYSSKQFSTLKKLSESVKIQFDFDISDYILIPIPLNKERYKKRGFNQAELIANTLSKKLNLPVYPAVLTRSKNTVSQFTLSRKERYKNMKDAFMVNKNVSNKKIILIDDICTTGSTLISAADELYKNGARKVNGFTLSRKP